MTVEEALKELNLNENFTKADLDKAQRDLIKIYNTDDPKHPPEGIEKMKRINSAYDVLKQELENRLKKSTLYNEDLSVFKKETIKSMFEKVDINRNISFFKTAPMFWRNFANETLELYNLYSNQVNQGNTKEEIENLKKQFEELLHKCMRQFSIQFFKENPYLEQEDDKEFETVREQLNYYRKLIQEARKRRKENLLSEIQNKVFVEDEIVESRFFSTSWKDYRDKLCAIFEEFKQEIEKCTSEKQLEKEKKLVDKKIEKQMVSFGDCFFKEYPYLMNQNNLEFKTVNEQLRFFKNLIEEYQLKWKKNVFALIEKRKEYKFAECLFRDSSLDDYLLCKIEKELEEVDFFKKDIEKVAIKIITQTIRTHAYGEEMLCMLSFTKEVESVFLYNQCLEILLKKDTIGFGSLLISRVVGLSTNRIESAKSKDKLRLCRNLVYDKNFYLQEVYKRMSIFLARHISSQNFTRNQLTNMYLNYMFEILELANNGIISVDTLITVEETVLVDPKEVLSCLELALNITKDPIINVDYLFVKIEEGRENPFAVLHRGKTNYELLFETELGEMQKEEISNPTRDKIVGYQPMRVILLNGEFIGKKVGTLEILYLYEGYYLVMDLNNNIKFYKKEQVKETKFEKGDETLQDPETVLLILCEKANEKYKRLLEEENEMRKKKKA